MVGGPNSEPFNHLYFFELYFKPNQMSFTSLSHIVIVRIRLVGIFWAFFLVNTKQQNSMNERMSANHKEKQCS